MAKWDVFRVAAHQQALGLEASTVRKLISSGKLGPDDCMRKSGRRNWHKISEVKGAIPTEPAPQQGVEETETMEDIFWFGGEPEVLEERTAPKPIDKDGWAEVESVRVTHEDEDIGDTLEPSAHEAEPSHEEEEEEEHAWHRRSLEVDEFDLTPMVDMTFLLNMFFIMTTSYALMRSIQLPAPSPSSSGKGASQAMLSIEDVRDHSIVVVIRGDNSVYVDDDKADPQRLAGVLKELMRTTGRSEVIVKPEPEAHHEAVVGVFDSAQEAGLQRIQLAVPDNRGSE